jgi:NAD(P)-dependent dehydrogenase (short-subunit alcohol dehydrogenase family)
MSEQPDSSPPPSFDLNGKVALVTGAARGIGRACAIALAQSGADVALGLRDAGSAGSLVKIIEGLGRRALPLQMDVTKTAEVASATEEALRVFGHIDVLVNNAGIGAPASAERVTEADFDATIAVNLKGTFFVSQAVARSMIARGQGCIVNLSSQAGFVALANESVYCMTKAAIAHLTKCLALEWGAHGVRVNAVAPTFIRTPGTEKWLKDEAFKAKVLARIPLGRVGEPVDVAGAVLFLASPAASLVTAATLMVDGGWTAH